MVLGEAGKSGSGRVTEQAGGPRSTRTPPFPHSPEPEPRRRSPRLRSDGPLIDAIAAGDQAALTEAYSQHASRVYGVARAMCGHTRAEDLTQEIFLQLWRNPHRYKLERGSLRSFLCMQAHSRAVDMLRSDTARVARELADNVVVLTPRFDTADDALAALDGVKVAALVTALPETERHPIALAYFGGHPYRDIAQLLGVPEGTIKSRIRSGLKRLRAAPRTQFSPS